MIDPPRIAKLLSADQHKLNFFFVMRKNKRVKCEVCFPVILMIQETMIVSYIIGLILV